MNILILGGGGREHALAWKLRQSPRVQSIFCAPGNAGISEVATCIPIKLTDQERLEECEQRIVALSIALAALSDLVNDIAMAVRHIVFAQFEQAERLPGERPLNARTERAN